MPTKMKIIGSDDNQKKNKDKIEILKLSASSMKTFDQCPRKYYYNYIAKEPRKQWDHFDLGNLCHRTLEIFHQVYMTDGPRGGTLSKLMGYSFSEARKEFPDMKGELISEAKDLVQGYLKKVSSTGMPLVKGVETEFNFFVKEDVKIRGFLDRIDILKDGTFHIVDYKTTKNVKYLEAFQLLLYGLWLKQEYPEINNFSASYILLRHGSKNKTYNFNNEDLKQVEKKVLTFADNISICGKEDSWLPIPSPLCKWCDFNSICPTQQGW